MKKVSRVLPGKIIPRTAWKTNISMGFVEHKVEDLYICRVFLLVYETAKVEQNEKSSIKKGGDCREMVGMLVQGGEKLGKHRKSGKNNLSPPPFQRFFPRYVEK